MTSPPVQTGPEERLKQILETTFGVIVQAVPEVRGFGVVIDYRADLNHSCNGVYWFEVPPATTAGCISSLGQSLKLVDALQTRLNDVRKFLENEVTNLDLERRTFRTAVLREQRKHHDERRQTGGEQTEANLRPGETVVGPDLGRPEGPDPGVADGEGGRGGGDRRGPQGDQGQPPADQPTG